SENRLQRLPHGELLNWPPRLTLSFWRAPSTRMRAIASAAAAKNAHDRRTPAARADRRVANTPHAPGPLPAAILRAARGPARRRQAFATLHRPAAARDPRPADRP